MLNLVMSSLLGLSVIVMSGLGGIVSVKSIPAEEKKAIHSWIFIGCGSLAFALTIAIGVVNYYAQEDATRKQQELSSSLASTKSLLDQEKQTLSESRLSEEFMKGQLSGLALMVGKIGSDSSTGTASLVKALNQISGGHATGIEPPAIQKMTNKQLADQVLDFCKQMLATAGAQEQKEDALFQNHQNNQSELGAMEDQFRSENRQKFTGPSIEYYNELTGG